MKTPPKPPTLKVGWLWVHVENVLLRNSGSSLRDEACYQWLSEAEVRDDFRGGVSAWSTVIEAQHIKMRSITGDTQLYIHESLL